MTRPATLGGSVEVARGVDDRDRQQVADGEAGQVLAGRTDEHAAARDVAHGQLQRGATGAHLDEGTQLEARITTGMREAGRSLDGIHGGSAQCRAAIVAAATFRAAPRVDEVAATRA